MSKRNNSHIATKKDYKNFRKCYTNNADIRQNVILSQNVMLSLDRRSTMRNTNTIVIEKNMAKSYGFIKSNLAQLGCSRVITDETGECFKTFAPFLIKYGKGVYNFNLKETEISNHYNPLLHCYDDKGNIDSQKVEMLVDIILRCSDAKSDDNFWAKAEKALLTALIYYVLENDDIPVDDKCFSTVLEKLYLAKPDPNADKRDKRTRLTKEIYEFKERMEIEGRKIMTPLYYDTFLIAPEKNRSEVVVCTITDLQFFKIPEIDRITRYNPRYKDSNIDFDDLAKTVTYLFVTIPMGCKYNILKQMFFEQLFSRLYELGEKELADKWTIYTTKFPGLPLVNPVFETRIEAEACQNELTRDNIISLPYKNGTKIYYLVWNNKILKKSFSKKYLERLVDNIKKCGVRYTNEWYASPALPIQVEFMFDDFIKYTDIPNIDIIMATSYKYRIGITMIVKGLNELKSRFGYDENIYNTILAYTDTIVYNGSNDMEDMKTIQKCIGKDIEIVKKGNVTITTEKDIVSMDILKYLPFNKCIVAIRDMPIFIDDKPSLLLHKNCEYIKRLNVLLFEYKDYFLKTDSFFI